MLQATTSLDSDPTLVHAREFSQNLHRWFSVCFIDDTAPTVKTSPAQLAKTFVFHKQLVGGQTAATQCLIQIKQTASLPKAWSRQQQNKVQACLTLLYLLESILGLLVHSNIFLGMNNRRNRCAVADLLAASLHHYSNRGRSVQHGK